MLNVPISPATTVLMLLPLTNIIVLGTLSASTSVFMGGQSVYGGNKTQDRFDRTILAILCMLVGAYAGLMLSASYVPTLKGYGCEGIGDPKGVVYAFEEDHFPRCKRIVEAR